MENRTIELSPKAFRLIASRDLFEANSILHNLFSSENATNVSLAISYLLSLDDKMLSYFYCKNNQILSELEFSENELAAIEIINRQIDLMDVKNLTASGNLDLKNIIGPMCLPFHEVHNIDLSNSSNLTLPILEKCFGEYISMNGACDLKFNILSEIYGSIWSNRANDILFKNLKIINGDVIMKSARNIAFDDLQQINGNLFLNKSSNVEFPKLIHVYGRLDVSFATKIHAPLLSKVGSVARSRNTELYAPLLHGKPKTIPYVP